MPHFALAYRLPAEDAAALARPAPTKAAPVLVAVPLLPAIANFDDLDPLKAEPGVEIRFLRQGQALPANADLVILIGSKATIADLDALRAQGWDIDIKAHARRGGKVLGLCGGYQMLGTLISDPNGLEGPPGAREGLGLLAVETTLTGEKTLRAASGVSLPDGVPFTGYEMHMGVTRGPGLAEPLLRFADGRDEGAVSTDGRIAGCYVHGLFGDDRQRARWLRWIGAEPAGIAYEAGIEETLDALAAHLERHLDLDRLLSLAR